MEVAKLRNVINATSQTLATAIEEIEKSVEIRVRRLPEAMDLPLPQLATAHSAGFDLRARLDRPLELEPRARPIRLRKRCRHVITIASP